MYQVDDETSQELELATSELREFEQRLELDEEKLKKAVAEYHTRLRSVVSAQMKARSVVNQSRLRVLASTMGPLSKSLGQSMARTRFRDCGSS